ncbi:MAG: Fic family protein [Opitutaceae bacterium]|jgi:Fic family protein|nr:Fic family protein [Opitutaceae bacterium]
MSAEHSDFPVSAAGWQPGVPYNNLPPLPPACTLETVAVLKRCVAARAALGELKMAAELIPNQAMLINTLPMLEARGSSEIENIVTTADALFRFAGKPDAEPDAATKEALRYRSALAAGFEDIKRRPLSAGTAIEVCSVLRGTPMRPRALPGTALANAATGEVVYTPPQGEGVINALLANWAEFLHTREELDPLVRMAVGHYQFEAIHPFSDGNGRTGRVLNILFLVQSGLLTLPVLYLSRHIIASKRDYYRLLVDITQNGGAAWEPWLLYMLGAVEKTALWTTRKIAEIRALAETTRAAIRARAPKIYTRELADLLFEQPYCRIENLIKRGIAKRETAARYLRELAGLGLLREQPAGRERLFINEPLMRLLRAEG